MIRLFNVYYPKRLLVLVAGEALLICASFILGAMLRLQDSWLVLEYENGLYKILGITVGAVICLYYFDLYDPHRVPSKGETYFRVLVAMGLMSFVLAGLSYFFPDFMMGGDTFVVGLFILTVALVGWRSSYAWLINRPFMRERIYVLGTGTRARSFVESLRARPEIGIDVAGWSAGLEPDPHNPEEIGTGLMAMATNREISRVIVALGDRRGTMPVRELLEVRLHGLKVEDVTGVLEKVSGKVEIDGLYPSWLIFAEGFRAGSLFIFVRRVISLIASFTLLLVILPFLPFIALAIKLDSKGPIFYQQTRVGRFGRLFKVVKFRTMRADAEATTGPMWAGETDPRITRVGRWLRKTRLDEIPQLWNVFRGDMGFVGPRPERPEFVEWLVREIPYYNFRHTIRPGITGWAQVCYQYGASMEEAKEKLKYDLYYTKNMSVGLDLVIILRSIKIVLFGYGAR